MTIFNAGPAHTSISRRTFFALVATTSLISSPNMAFSQEKQPFKLAVLTDMSSAYADLTGPGSVLAITMAAEDFGGEILDGRKIEVISADHQNRPEVATSTAQRWFDVEGVSAILDLATSSTALAVQAMATQYPQKSVLVTSGVASTIAGKSCTANTIQAVPNAYATTRASSVALVEEGFDKWFYLQVDNLGGTAYHADSSAAVKAAGGEQVGHVKFPIGSVDLSSYILQAASSGANVLAIAGGGGDAVTAMKQANEFGLMASGLRMASFSFDVTDARSIGLDVSQGTFSTLSFYWDMNDSTREWAQRFFERHGKMPTQYQATGYLTTLHYLERVAEAGTDDAEVVIPKMRETPVWNFGNAEGTFRADNLLERPLFLGQVKTPEESTGDWDVFEIVREIAGADGFMPIAESECPLAQ